MILTVLSRNVLLGFRASSAKRFYSYLINPDTSYIFTDSDFVQHSHDHYNLKFDPFKH